MNNKRAGTSEAAIQHHYDIGNDFFRGWLDRTMTYSCPMWQFYDLDCDLDKAQVRKLDFHIENTHVHENRKMKVLDVGCGWGSLLQRMVDKYRVSSAVGLTLSLEQASYIRSLSIPGIDVLVQSWHDHKPIEPYDAIISIEAFEHFGRIDQSYEERTETYRVFFKKCREMIAHKGMLSMQSTCYETLDRLHPFISEKIWPESELPRLEQIIEASSKFFEVVSVINDREQYARTCEVWSKQLKKHYVKESSASDLVIAGDYYRYLKMSSAAFQQGALSLYRVVFRAL